MAKGRTVRTHSVSAHLNKTSPSNCNQSVQKVGLAVWYLGLKIMPYHSYSNKKQEARLLGLTSNRQQILAIMRYKGNKKFSTFGTEF